MKKRAVRVVAVVLVAGALIWGLRGYFKASRKETTSSKSSSPQTTSSSQSKSTKEEAKSESSTSASFSELLEKAKEAYQAKKLEEAENYLVQAESLQQSAELYNLWGNVLRDQGKREEAKKKYREAIEKDKKFITAYLNLATLYQEEENYDKALEVVEEGLKYNPNNQDLLNTKTLIEMWQMRSQ